MDELSGKKGFIFDLDGVVYIGDTPIHGAIDTLKYLRETGRKILFLTNNSSRTRKQYVEKLRGMGVECAEEEVVTSGYGLALYLKEKYKGGKCFVIGESGIIDELVPLGFEVVSGEEGEMADFVAVGIDRGFNYDKLTTALRAVRNGAKFIGAIPDLFKPREDGPTPGGGALIAALEACSGVKPEVVIGKPNSMLFEIAVKGMGLKKKEVAVVGDLVYTDIVGGNRFGLHTILVLSGITRKEELRGLRGERKPELVLNSIADLGKLL